MIRPFFNIVYSYTPICHGHGNVEYLFVFSPGGSAIMADIRLIWFKLTTTTHHYQSQPLSSCFHQRCERVVEKSVSSWSASTLIPKVRLQLNRGYHFHMSDSSVETFRPSLAIQTMNDWTITTVSWILMIELNIDLALTSSSITWLIHGY